MTEEYFRASRIVGSCPVVLSDHLTIACEEVKKSPLECDRSHAIRESLPWTSPPSQEGETARDSDQAGKFVILSL
jgi:hypothetical protein